MPKKSCKVLMMVKAAKPGWVGAGAGKKQGWTRSRKGRSRAGQEQGRIRYKAGAARLEQSGSRGRSRSRAGAG